MQSERIKNLPKIDTLLKISIGLMVVAIISSAFVYAETGSVTVDGVKYDVVYSGNNVSVNSIDADLDFVSLIFSVSVVDTPASLDVTLDRNFFDSKYQGLDEDFFVLVDGEDVSFEETSTTSQSRTLSIELLDGSAEIEIIGSVFGSSSEEEPVACTKEYIPVCGVDGTTYGNQCMLNAADVELDYQGECVAEPEPPVEKEPDVVSPKPEEPTTKPPVVTKPPVTSPKTQCGPGTVLKDGVCVLDQRCGPGTILKDGACVLAPEPTPSTSTSVKGMGKELVIGLIAAFVVAGVVGIILGLISKASKSRD